MLRTDALEYDLPDELIATRPAEPRDACRLMVVSRSDPSRLEHRVFHELPGLLRAGDLMVFNTTRVLPARLRARREDTGGAVEGLYLGTLGDGLWKLMLRAGSRLRDGNRLRLLDARGDDSRFALRVAGRDGGCFLAAIEAEGGSPTVARPASEILDEVGATPLPPYILKARRDRGERDDDALDRAWYQNVYAEAERAGSVAAPTAGMHFTPAVLDRLRAWGVERADVCLHVGEGTFKPIETEYVEQHPMHAEWFRVEPAAIASLERARCEHRRIIAVGTTSARTIESLPRPVLADARAGGAQGETRILITPGFDWRWTEGMVTNFHLPRSTLLAMVGALFPGGVARLIELYRAAIVERYRFYSYGDAMLILP